MILRKLKQRMQVYFIPDESQTLLLYSSGIKQCSCIIPIIRKQKVFRKGKVLFFFLSHNSQFWGEQNLFKNTERIFRISTQINKHSLLWRTVILPFTLLFKHRTYRDCRKTNSFE